MGELQDGIGSDHVHKSPRRQSILRKSESAQHKSLRVSMSMDQVEEMPIYYSENEDTKDDAFQADPDSPVVEHIGTGESFRFASGQEEPALANSHADEIPAAIGGTSPQVKTISTEVAVARGLTALEPGKEVKSETTLDLSSTQPVGLAWKQAASTDSVSEGGGGGGGGGGEEDGGSSSEVKECNADKNTLVVVSLRDQIEASTAKMQKLVKDLTNVSDGMHSMSATVDGLRYELQSSLPVHGPENEGMHVVEPGLSGGGFGSCEVMHTIHVVLSEVKLLHSVAEQVAVQVSDTCGADEFLVQAMNAAEDDND